MAGLVLALSSAAWAQVRAEPPTARRATTLDALAAYPGFFHLHSVRVRAKLLTDQVGTALIGGDTRILVLGDAVAGRVDGDVEVTGTFVDVGRLTQDDPRTSTYGLMALSQKVLRRDWPAHGELPVIVAQDVVAATPLSAPSVRTLALEPARYDGQTVTVAGRFRGRNLYGDQPAAPGRSRYDFVIQLADATVWVAGRRPRGNGLDLNVEARVDTGRWVEVQGDVRTERGLVWIDAIAIRPTQPTSENAPAETDTAPAPPAPAPQVIFSAPTTDEVDVSAEARVRIQFSRDMVPESFKGAVTASYRTQEATERGVASSPSLVVTGTYDAGRRVLEVRFNAPLERFRTVDVMLGEGIMATDKQPLLPWRLSFRVGG